MTKTEISKICNSKDSKAMAKALDVNGTKLNKIRSGDMSDAFAQVLSEKIEKLDLNSIPDAAQKDLKPSDDEIVNLINKRAQKNVAEALGITPQTLRRWLANKNFPTDHAERAAFVKKIKGVDIVKKADRELGKRIENLATAKMVAQYLTEHSDETFGNERVYFWKKWGVPSKYVSLVKECIGNPVVNGQVQRTDEDKIARCTLVRSLIPEGVSLKEASRCTGIDEKRLAAIRTGRVYASDEEIYLLKNMKPEKFNARENKYSRVVAMYGDRIRDFMQSYYPEYQYKNIPSYTEFFSAAKRYDGSISEFFGISNGLELENQEGDNAKSRLVRALAHLNIDHSIIARTSSKEVQLYTVLYYCTKYNISLDWILNGAKALSCVKQYKKRKEQVDDKQIRVIADEFVSKADQSSNHKFIGNLFGYGLYWSGEDMDTLRTYIKEKGNYRVYVNKTNGYVTVETEEYQQTEPQPNPPTPHTVVRPAPIKADIRCRKLVKLPEGFTIREELDVIKINENTLICNIVGIAKLEDRIDNVCLFSSTIATEFTPIYIGTELVGFAE